MGMMIDHPHTHPDTSVALLITDRWVSFGKQTRVTFG